MSSKMKQTKGERLNIRFNRKIKPEFHGARLTSDGGLLAYRELDEALGLFKSAPAVMNDRRTRRSLLVKLIKIGAKVVRHSRCVTFQMAEVAISKEIFAKILSRINRLRCCWV